MKMENKEYYINYAFMSVRLEISDKKIVHIVQSVFDVDTFKKNKNCHSISINCCKNKERCRYIVYCNNLIQETCDNCSEIIYNVTKIIGELICCELGEDTCVLHAASVFIENKLILLLGPSGSGKTTLSLLLTKYGYYVGDEYVMLDINNGYIWNECYPVQIKEHNRLIVEIVNEKDNRMNLVSSFSKDIGKVFYIPLRKIKRKNIERSDKIKPDYFVFVHFNKDIEKSKITKISVDEFPLKILQSIVGKQRPSKLFKQFIQMKNKTDILHLDLFFSDGVDAARKLYSYITSEEI